MIYNEFYPESKINMIDSLATYDESWNIEPHDGCSPDNINVYESLYDIPNTGRYKKFVNESKYLSKKCCFYSHFSLWNYCADNLEFIVIVENDVEAVHSFPLKEVSNFFKNKVSAGIQITTESMTAHTKRNKKHNKKYYEYLNGIHPIYFTNSTGKRYFMGATGYILNNSACRYLVKNCKLNGWAQNDLLFNADDDFDLFFIKPSIAEYKKHKENHTSSNKQ